MKKVIAIFEVIVLIAVLALSAYMFASSGNVDFLRANYKLKLVSAEKIPRDLTEMDEVLSDSENQKAFMDFGIKLLLDNYTEEENTQLSPLSIYLATAILTNATAGETQTELLSLLGMDNIDALNDYAGYLYSRYAEDEDTDEVITIGNSIWYDESMCFNLKQSYLDLNSRYYGADIFKTDFDDKAIREMNSWVNDKTRGLIPHVIDEIDPLAIFYIINALSFIQCWTKVYTYQTDTFTLSDNSTKELDFIKNDFEVYYKSDLAKSFRMYFKNTRFSFIGILPDGNLNDYLEKFDKDELYTLMTNSVLDSDVFTSVPKFSSEKKFSLADTYKNLEVSKVFNDKESDFSGFSDNDIFTSDIIHQSNFSLDKNGVKMAAVTAIECVAESAHLDKPDVYIYLNRPFIYGIIDNVYNVPIYLGICNNP